ncbi:MAG: response regulator [Bacteroidetes bacterium]|nr:response regulator [Bacteroidota bacterium]
MTQAITITEQTEIILVEDNPDDAFFTKRALKEASVNNHIIHIKAGDEAIDFFFNDFAVSEEKFTGKTKLILLDMNLPKVNGIEILTQLKLNSTTQAIPVVILTSSMGDPMMREALNLGAESYIQKPVTYEGFQKVINQLSDRL